MLLFTMKPLIYVLGCNLGECKIMQNRKAMGSLQEHFIRQHSKPTIVEMDDPTSASVSKDPSPKTQLITEIGNGNGNQPLPPEPEYTILREPPEGKPEFLVMEVQLPKVPSSQSVTLDVGEDRVRLVALPSVYLLDIDLPYLLDVDNVGAQFNKDTRVLSVTLPVAGRTVL